MDGVSKEIWWCSRFFPRLEWLQTGLRQSERRVLARTGQNHFHSFRHIIIKFPLKSFFSGTAGDSLSYHRGSPFSTKDRDNDASSSINCASHRKGSWWYKNCYYSNLNGLYMNGKDNNAGMVWYHWKNNHKSVKRSEMKIRTLLVWTKRWICAQQIHKVSCALVLKVKFSNNLEVHVLLFKVKIADEAMK